jgi:hypothetical protein
LLSNFGRWVQSVGMDTAGAIEQCLSRQIHTPAVWQSFAPQPVAASLAASVQQQSMKIKHKVGCVFASCTVYPSEHTSLQAKIVSGKLGVTVEESFASTVFWRMQENTRLASTLTTTSPLFHMLPPPSCIENPLAHTEDVQALLDAMQFPIMSAS